MFSAFSLFFSEIRKLIVPPHMAYGEKGHPPVIPGDATLTFVIECLQITKRPWAVLSSGTRQFAMLLGAIVVVGLLVYEVVKKARAEEDEGKKKKKEKKEMKDNRKKNTKKGK
jgi:FKBP-type peptidyl-prolyl cis-trans isomerase